MSVFRALLFLTILLVSKAALDASDYEKYIRFHWKGELQSHSITLKVFPYLDKLQKDGMTTFLFLYTKLENQLKVINNISISFQEEEYPVTQVNITSLSPNTQYFYTFGFTSDTSLLEKDFLEHYNTTSPQEFSFKTPNIALKPYSFTFGAASCAQTGSINPVFQNLTDENLNFFIHMGDLHYSDIDKNDTKLFYEAYYKVFNSAVQRQFFESTPIVYNWDDHDFGVNDAMGTSASKPAATEAYKKFVPYYPLKNGLPDDDSLAFPNQAPIANRDPKGYLSYQNSSEFGIFRSFIIGRCLFIIMDLRSFQSIIPGDIFGEEQKVWIENQLRFAGDNAGIKMVFMVSSVPWIDSDRGALWEDFTIEQEWLGKLVEQHLYGNQKKIMLLAGDAHMLALDDGRNNKHGGFPVVQAASLDQRPHCKGGPYSHGHSIDRGQYAVLEVIDDAADQICVKVNLKRLGTSLISYDTCHPELYPQSEDQHCPPKVMAYLAPDSNTLYVILGCVILGVIFASGVYWYKSKNKEKKGAAKQGNQKYDLATEEQDIDDLDKSSQNQKGKSQEEIYTERNSEIDFHGSI